LVSNFHAGNIRPDTGFQLSIRPTVKGRRQAVRMARWDLT
jgi:hypothetical protein